MHVRDFAGQEWRFRTRVASSRRVDDVIDTTIFMALDEPRAPIVQGTGHQVLSEKTVRAKSVCPLWMLVIPSLARGWSMARLTIEDSRIAQLTTALRASVDFAGYSGLLFA